MDPLFILKTTISPEIVFDPEAGLFVIRGESRPEYPQKFYQKVFEWFDGYFVHTAAAPSQHNVNLVVDFDYFNSTTAKVIYDLLMHVKSGFQQTGGHLVITWCHDKMDEDMMHSGKELESLTRLPFRFEAK